MSFQSRIAKPIALTFLLLMFVLSACERPARESDDGAVVDPVTNDDSADQGDGDAVEGDAGDSGDVAETDTTDAAAGDDAESSGELEVPEETAETDAYPADETDSNEGEAPRPEDETTDEATTTDETTADESAETTDEDTSDEADETTADESAETTDENGADEADQADEDEGDDSDDSADEAAEETSAAQTHTVAVGENLYRIGLQYGIGWVELANANNLPAPYTVYVGQVLTIPGTGTPSAPAPTTEVMHTVAAGETLFRIGLAYNVNYLQIAEANGLVNPNNIYVGQVLKIPTAEPSNTAEGVHTILPGQTLSQIAAIYGVSITSIAERNGLTPPYLILAGTTLIIPGE